MSVQQPTVAVVGPSTERTMGPYGEHGCAETLHLRVDGEDVYVPWTGVRLAGYGYYGDVPDEFDVDRIILYDGVVHGEADVDAETVVELIPEYGPSSELRSYETWELRAFDASGPADGTVIHEREP